MIKKILILVVTLAMCLGIFSGCSGGDGKKIDIGGEIIAGKPSSSVQIRVLLDDDTFSRGDKIKLTVGFGFRNGQNVPFFTAIRSLVKLVGLMAFLNFLRFFNVYV